MNVHYSRLAFCAIILFAGSTAASDCSTIEVQSGDSCGSLASSCGISGNQFTQYNPQPNLCSTLQVGEHVCCSAGSNPYLPTENADGSCATHQVGSGEYCSLIATNYSLTVTQLSNFNNNTWGWEGCDNLEEDFIMCVSDGSPPMPAAVPNAECGPQVSGTPQPSDMSQLAGLNPCSLNACCDKWGQCGTTSEFCTPSNSSTGAPGTSAPGTNGCISNCGVDIVNNGQAPAEFIKVGYFEAFNAQRPCLTMAPVNMDTSQYTHVHFAFGNVTSGSWDISASQYGDFFDQFVNLSGVKRIISFGGWAFSTDASTYSIFREAMQPDNYQTFANNVVDFVNQNNLDGVDFDWEYPGETDIPGIPPSSTIDPADYLTFIQYTRGQLGSDKSMSIAAPSSYWYLKGFPLANISESLSYIVYMTYDLHGQWDYQNTYADSGCPAGSCLRCHVNLTETMNSLSMITKAGVPSYKVVVGVANYARSFGMTDSSCTGPDCTFTGPESGATLGNCTQTGGYLSNAEIPSSADTWYDSESDCMISTWDGTWAGYMDSKILDSRTSTYQGLNMGGTTLWAIDLQGLDEGNANNTAPFCDDPQTCPFVPWDPCTNTYTSISALYNDTSVPPYCINQYLIQTLSTVMDGSLANYTNIMQNDNYQKKFDVYSNYVQQTAGYNMANFLANSWESYFTCPGSAWGNSIEGGPASPANSCGPMFDINTGWAGVPVGEWDYVFTNESGFWDDVGSSQGVQQGWCSIEDFYKEIPATTGKNPVEAHRVNITNVPFPASTFNVTNPQQIIQKALANYTNIQTLLHEAVISASDMYFVSSYTSDNDSSASSSTVQAFVIPVLTLQSSVQSMQNVVDTADQIISEKNAERIKTILIDVFTAVLVVIPGIGDELAELGGIFESIGETLGLVADLGNFAIDLYNTVSDPKQAWALIFDALAILKDFSEAGVRFIEERAEGGVEKLGDAVSVPEGQVHDRTLVCVRPSY